MVTETHIQSKENSMGTARHLEIGNWKSLLNEETESEVIRDNSS